MWPKFLPFGNLPGSVKVEQLLGLPVPLLHNAQALTAWWPSLYFTTIARESSRDGHSGSGRSGTWLQYKQQSLATMNCWGRKSKGLLFSIVTIRNTIQYNSILTETYLKSLRKQDKSYEGGRARANAWRSTATSTLCWLTFIQMSQNWRFHILSKLNLPKCTNASAKFEADTYIQGFRFALI